MLVKVDPPRGMLEYATAVPRYWITFRGAGRSKGSPAEPQRVAACYSRAHKVSVVGYGAVSTSRIIQHYREASASN